MMEPTPDPGRPGHFTYSREYSDEGDNNIRQDNNVANMLEQTAMIEKGQDGTATSSLSSHILPDEQQRRIGLREYLVSWAKSFGFGFALSYALGIEGKIQVAFLKNRFWAAAKLLVHIPGIVGILSIARLIFLDTWLGVSPHGAAFLSNDDKMLGILFAAKLLEISVVTVMTSIVLTFMRHDIIQNHGFPLAGLTAGTQFADLSFLLSREFMSLLTVQYTGWVRKTSFILLLFVSASLSTFVSSAASQAFLPTIKWRYAGGVSVTINATGSEMFPDILSAADIRGGSCQTAGGIYCPTQGWEQLRDSYGIFLSSTGNIIPEGLASERALQQSHTISIWGTKSMLGFYNTWRSEGNEAEPYTVATMPHHAISNGAVLAGVHWNLATSFHNGKYGNRRDTDVEALEEATAAIVRTRCEYKRIVIPQNIANQSAGSILATVPFPNLQQDSLATIQYSDSLVSRWMKDIVYANLTRPSLVWIDLYGTMPNASIGAAIALPVAKNGSEVDLYGCASDAQWKRTWYEVEYSSLMTRAPHNQIPKRTLRDSESGRNTVAATIESSYGRRINILPSYAEFINANVFGPEDGPANTVIEEILIAADLWSKQDITGNTIISPRSRHTPHLESILNIMLCNSLARTRPDAAPFSELKNKEGEWWEDFIPHRPRIDHHIGDAYKVEAANADNEDADVPTAFFTFPVSAWVEGYEYTWRSRTSFASIVLLLVYALIAFIFGAVKICKGTTSNVWATPSEVVALALRSPAPPPGTLDGIGAGFTSRKPLGVKYRVVATEQERRRGDGDGNEEGTEERWGKELMLEVADDKEPISEDRRVKCNIKYD